MTRMSRLLAHPAAHSCFFTSKPARRPPTLTPPLPVTQPPRCRDHNCYKHQQTNHPCTPLSPRSALRARTKKRHERRDGSGVTQDVIRYLDTHVSVAYLVCVYHTSCVCSIPRVQGVPAKLTCKDWLLLVAHLSPPAKSLSSSPSKHTTQITHYTQTRRHSMPG